MGLFNNKVAESTNEALEYLLNEDATRNQSLALLLGLATILVFRLFNTTRSKLLNGGHARECVLKISELNNTTLVKEVFLAYLNAALLEPVLTIGGMEDLNKEEFFLNLFELLSLCWWIWLLTDAFDFFDVMQFYKFHVEFKEEAEKNPKYSFLRFTKRKVVDELERQSLVGSLKKDVALWFMLACIGAAWAPDISINHRDALHAYVVVFMWAIMHHRSQKAVNWTDGYFYTLLFPSTAVMPLEYCLPLMDVFDVVEDLDFLLSYREFVKERTGIALIIES